MQHMFSAISDKEPFVTEPQFFDRHMQTCDDFI